MNVRVFLVAFLLFFLAASQSFATEGVSIEPAVQKIYLTEAGTTREPIDTVTIKNTTGLELLFNIRAIEFSDIDKNGGNIFLGQSLEAGEFSEANWIQVSENQILLIPGEQKEITFHIQNPEGILPGAHYGALLFETLRPENSQDPEASKIFLRQIATSLIYVSKEAGNEQKISLQAVKRYHNFPKLIESLALTFANEGNSFAEPRGFVEVRNMFGSVVDKSVLNESSKLVFPGQQREIEVKFTTHYSLLPGPYTFHVHYRIGEEEYQIHTLKIWYWEPLLILIGISIMAGITRLAWQKRKKEKNTPKDE
jgi:hypothetical protein